MKINKSEKLKNHVLDIADDIDCGIFSPPTEYSAMCHELINFFLGEDWCSINPQNDKQCMTEALYDIEYMFLNKCDKKYRKKILK